MSWEIFEAAAAGYDRWYATPRGRRVDRGERELIAWLLGRFPLAHRVLEIGCGTGHFAHSLHTRGYWVAGLDRAPAMLVTMRSRWPIARAVLGDADSLPFGDCTFDVALFVTSLEFLPHPRNAIIEAARVARSGLAIVVLNRWSLGGLSRRFGLQARQPLLGRAADYTAAALQALVRTTLGSRLHGLSLRSGCFPRSLWPTPSRLPLGDVIGLAAVLR